MHDGRYAKTKAGQVLDVVAGGSTTSLTVPTITGVVDPGTDSTTGKITGVRLPANLLADCWGNQVSVTTDVSGYYAASFASLLDIYWETTVAVAYRNAGGNWLVTTFASLNGLVANLNYSEVYGCAAPDASVTATVNHAGTVVTKTTQADPHGWWLISFKALGPGDKVTAQVGGQSIASTVSALTASLVPAEDRITGTGPPDSQVSAYGWRQSGLRGWYIRRLAPTDTAGCPTAVFSPGELEPLHSAWVIHHDSTRADTLLFAWPRIAIADWARNRIRGLRGARRAGHGHFAHWSDSA